MEGLSDADTRTMELTAAGTRKQFAKLMGEFHALRNQIKSDYRETVAARFYAMTGRQPGPSQLDTMTESGDAENMVAEAVQLQRGAGAVGQAQLEATLAEVRERHDVVVEVEEGMAHLHQIFLDMATLVEQQGELLDNIEVQVARSTECAPPRTKNK